MPVDRSGCAALANLAGNLDGKLAVARAGGGAAVAAALLRFDGAAVAEEGCRCLANIASGDAECKHAVCAAAGPRALVKAAVAHLRQQPPQVLLGASHGFGFLAVAAASGVFVLDDTAWVADAVEVMRRGMASHANHPHLQVQAQWSLHYLNYVSAYRVSER